VPTRLSIIRQTNRGRPPKLLDTLWKRFTIVWKGMPPSWSADEYQRIMVSGTTCLCLLIFVIGTFWLVRVGAVGPTALGAVSGTGLLGIGGLLVKILRIAIRKG
jgi:hypothetical protein